ncbi:hypothetical protein PHYBOEH_007795 [Phytophthora boehmeriae]|uniref:Uncharacterized protein n=1 Tax=Phytophthora boehmeriae TaxID=109152 RepID=A0A8T1W5C1_9STRA|nr:hypothetical protein PHYBOEH_007795 [Phytophthora boehmeriae]
MAPASRYGGHSSQSNSPRRSMQRSVRFKPLLMYLGIAFYAGCLLFWWLYLRGDANRLGMSRWKSVVLPNSNSALEMFEQATTFSSGDGAQIAANTLLDTFARGIRPADSELLALHKRHGIPDYKCVGWRQTSGCSPDGVREPGFDKGCGGIIKAGNSGYCVVRDEATGQEFHAMKLNCTSLRKGTTFKCSQAVDFVRVAPQIDALIAAKNREMANEDKDNKTMSQLRGSKMEIASANGKTEPLRGLLMVVYPKLLQSVHATVRLLRSYNCTLPVELWFLESEMGPNPLGYSRVLQSLVKDYGPISLKGITDNLVVGFTSKVYALAHSGLDQLLFLDADNAPVKDPTYLFDTPEFLTTGSLFWPDFWTPQNTIFNIKQRSLIWELLQVPFVDMFEQESGQLMIDRRRTGVALHVAQFLAMREPRHLETLRLLYGDKDLFRLAWLKTSTPFHMIVTPPSSLGMTRGKQFCGMTMVQHDTRGDVIFLHRNGKKLTGEEDYVKDHTWRQLQTFVFPDELAPVDADAAKRYAFVQENYNVVIFKGGKGFVKTRMCYGDRFMKSKHFRLTPWKDLPWHELEDTLLNYARDASVL